MTRREINSYRKCCARFSFPEGAIDSALLCSISVIVLQPATPPEHTMRHTTQLLDYISTQEEEVLTYNVSNMKLAVHSNASYLSEPKARNKAGGGSFC